MSVSPTSPWVQRGRSSVVAGALAVALLLTGCAAPSVAVPTSTAAPVYSTVDATPTSRSAESTAAPSTTATSTATTSSMTSSSAPSSPSPQLTSEVTSVTAEVATSAPAVTFDPATLPDVPAPDPEVAGDDSGPVCASNAGYFDEDPTGLDQNAVTAWRAVETAANAQGLVVCLNDGKRSRAQQQATYDEYVTQYGQTMADQYVLTPEKSAHVAGYAIDVQPAAAFNWLEATNGSFGFCRTYDNEAWHFEFNRSFAATGCPPRLPAPVR